MFRTALAKRCCLVPAAAFYEWKVTPAGKAPHAIARADGDPLAFAGLWEWWRSPEGDDLRTFAIITTKANAQMAELHNRMPVIVEAEDWSVWLGEEQGEAAALLCPAPEGILKLCPVDRRVGNVCNDGPDLIAPEIPPVPDSPDAAVPNPL